MSKQKFPKGWDEARVQRLISHYERQNEDEQVAEDEAVQETDGQTLMTIPTELVPAVRELIARKSIGLQAKARKARLSEGPVK